MSARRAGNRKGFTLIEMVVVMLVLSAMALVTLPAFLNPPQDDDMTLAVRRVDALFRLARDSAARGGTRVSVVVDSATSHVWLDVAGVSQEQASTAPAGVSAFAARTDGGDVGEALELPGTVRVQLSKERALFSFAPSGATFADSLWLVGPLNARLVTINPWTGDVLVH